MTLLSAISTIWVARSEGPAIYASFLVASNLVFIVATLCDPGVTWAFAKIIALQEEQGQHNQVRSYSSGMLVIGLLLGGVAGAIVALIFPWLEKNLHVMLGSGFRLAFMPLLLCAVLAAYADGIYFGLLRAKQRACILLGGPLISLIYLAVRHFWLPLPLLGTVAAFHISGAAIAISLLCKDRLLGKMMPLPSLYPVMRDAGPGASLTALSVLFTWSDRWVVGSRLDGVSLSYYSAATALLQVSLRMPTSIANLLLPASSHNAQESGEKNSNFCALAVTAFSGISVWMIVIVSLNAPALMTLMFGYSFLPGVPALLMMTPRLLAAALSTPLTRSLYSSPYNYLVTVLLAVVLPLRLVFLYAFTNLWGLTGTALATTLSDWILAAGCIMAARQAQIYISAKTVLLPVIAGLIALATGISVRSLGASTFSVITIVTVVYLPLLWIMIPLISKSGDKAIAPKVEKFSD